MRKFKLEPKSHAKGKYLRIDFVAVKWDERRRVLKAVIMFHQTRNSPENKPLAAVLYADNAETLEKMLRECNSLYPVRKGMVVSIPEPREKIRCSSHSEYAFAHIERM